MSELNQQQLKDNNPFNVAYGISTLLETIATRDEEKLKTLGGEHPEVKTLLDKCKDENIIIATAASQSLVKLVENGILTIPYTISTFIAIAPFCSNLIGITTGLSQILIIDLKLRYDIEKKYVNKFNLISPQHPFISILKENKRNTWQPIINQIINLYNHTDKIVQENCMELLRPVILYMICSPNISNDSLIYRHQLWNQLLSQKQYQSIELCLPWLQTNKVNESQMFYLQLSNGITENKSNIIIQITSLINLCIISNEDPSLLINSLEKLLNDDDDDLFTWSCVICMLSHTITKSPVIYLPSILNLCSKIINENKCIRMSGKILIASLLPWLAYPSILTSDICKKSQELMQRVDNITINNINEIPDFNSSQLSPLAYTSVQIIKIICSESNNLNQWFTTIINTKLRSNIYLLFGANLIDNCSTECLSQIITLVNEKPELSSFVITWMLYRLANEKSPKIQLQLLKSLPLMAKQKNNMPFIVQALESLKTKIQLKPLILKLYLEFWKIEPRCYPYLHKLLIEKVSTDSINLKDKTNWEIAKAVVIKEICASRPDQHGKDLVPIISDILNTCTNDESALAASLALESITILCRAKIVDVVTSWKALGPRLTRDKRSRVLQSLCSMMGLFKDVILNTENSKIFIEVLIKLWNYVTDHNDKNVKLAALRALGEIPLEKLCLKVIPAQFRKNIKLPSEYCKTPVDAARKPEDVLTYIPGQCWPQLLAELPIAEEYIKKLLCIEVAGYRGVLHRTPGKPEPRLPTLPADSVLVGLLSHIKSENDSALLPILNILSSDLPQILPPCDWNFLIDFKQYEFLCLKIAASQANKSPTAQIVADKLVNSIKTQMPEDFNEENYPIFSILNLLCQGVQPMTLKSLIEGGLDISLKKIRENGSNETFKYLMKSIKIALHCSTIHEANRILLFNIMETLLDSLSVNDQEVFSSYVECASNLPTKYLNRMCSPSLWWEITPNKLEKAIIIRSYLAKNGDVDTPLTWMNECIDIVSTRPSQHELLLKYLKDVYIECKNEKERKEWILKLMGHIEASHLKFDEQKINVSYLLDVFSLAIIIFTGHNCFSTEIIDKNDLPQALYSLLATQEWNDITDHVIEWLNNINKLKITNGEMKQCFIQCLQILRFTKSMQDIRTWQRIINSIHFQY